MVLTAEGLATEWKTEGFNVKRDVFAVETRDGRLVASEEFCNESGHCSTKGLGIVLMRRAFGEFCRRRVTTVSLSVDLPASWEPRVSINGRESMWRANLPGMKKN